MFSQPIAARGAAFSYLSNNGRVNIAINCDDQPAMLLEANVITNHWLSVSTIGTRPNRGGVVGQLHLLTEDGKNQYAVVDTGGSYLSASDKRVHFGLGGNKSLKELEVYWPNGAVQKYGHPGRPSFDCS